MGDVDSFRGTAGAGWVGVSGLTTKAADRDEIERLILEAIVADGRISPDLLTPDATMESLGVPSIEIVMLLRIEQKFGIYVPIDEQLSEAGNLREFISIIAGRIVTGAS